MDGDNYRSSGDDDDHTDDGRGGVPPCADLNGGHSGGLPGAQPFGNHCGGLRVGQRDGPRVELRGVDLPGAPGVDRRGVLSGAAQSVSPADGPSGARRDVDPLCDHASGSAPDVAADVVHQNVADCPGGFQFCVAVVRLIDSGGADHRTAADGVDHQSAVGAVRRQIVVADVHRIGGAHHAAQPVSAQCVPRRCLVL
ncbi:MAG: hypothetical protein KJN99_11490 [Marinicaulis sp.]|nr:hypothetical protein [Marinicaulis sp.]